MRIIKVLFILLFCFVVTVKVAANANGVLLESSSLDIGTVVAGNSYVSYFKIRNISDKKIKIKNVVFNECSCRFECLRKFTIEPGSTFLFNFKYVPYAVKKTDRTVDITLFTDSEKQPKLSLKIKATIKPKVKKDFKSKKTLKVDNKASLASVSNISVKNLREKALATSSVHSEKPKLVHLSDYIPEGKKYYIEPLVKKCALYISGYDSSEKIGTVGLNDTHAFWPLQKEKWEFSFDINSNNSIRKVPVKIYSQYGFHKVYLSYDITELDGDWLRVSDSSFGDDLTWNLMPVDPPPCNIFKIAPGEFNDGLSFLIIDPDNDKKVVISNNKPDYEESTLWRIVEAETKDGL